MVFTRVDTEVEPNEVVENRSVEMHMHGLFAIDHHGVWFYLAHSFNGEDVVIDTGTRNNLMPHPGDTTRPIRNQPYSVVSKKEASQ
jgi:hypothetical protein